MGDDVSSVDTSEALKGRRQESFEMSGDGDSADAVSGGRESGQASKKKWTIWKMRLRDQEDDLPQDWWFASTAIPLLAATIGPLANVLSIAALVSTWRVALPNGGVLPEGADDNGTSIPDPRWYVRYAALWAMC